MNEDWSADRDDMEITVPDDSFFVMGDNRLESFDSRHFAEDAIENGLAKTQEKADDFTYVCMDDVVSKAVVIVWPLSHVGLIR